ncbi:hypothetical protein GCM10009780_10320 [Actinomadura alba]
MSDAGRTSMGNVIVTPAPTAGPLIAPITGLRQRAMRNATVPARAVRQQIIVSGEHVMPLRGVRRVRNHP